MLHAIVSPASAYALRKTHFHLRIERAFADATAAGLLAAITDASVRTAPSISAAGTTRLTRPNRARSARRQLARGRSSSVRLRPMLRPTPTAGVLRSCPALIPAVRGGRIGGHREIAIDDQLTSGSGRDAMHARDHRLRNPASASASFACTLRTGHAANRGRCGRASPFKSWPAQNARPAPASDDARIACIRCNRVQRRIERRDHRGRQRVEAIAAIERQRSQMPSALSANTNGCRPALHRCVHPALQGFDATILVRQRAVGRTTAAERRITVCRLHIRPSSHNRLHFRYDCIIHCLLI